MSSTQSIKRLDINKIIVSKERREIDAEKVASIANSIKAIGLQHRNQCAKSW